MRFFLILSVMAFLLAACGPGESVGFQATVDAAASGNIGTEEALAERFFALVSGDVEFSADIAVASRDANGVIELRFLSRESSQGISITIPANIPIGRVDLTTPGLAVLVLTGNPATPTPGSIYNQLQTTPGVIVVSSVGETISGEFNVMVGNELGGSVNLLGEFTNIPIENE